MRVLRILGTTLVAAGVLALLDAGVTLAWREPVSSLYALVQQDRLDGRLDDVSRELLGGREAGKAAAGGRVRADGGARASAGPRRTASLARRLRRRSAAGEPLGRIRIPAIGASYVLVEGTDPGSLRKGPGHYPETPLPGMRGTVAVAGHRTTYLAPFRRIDELRRGDRITLQMPYETFAYRVQGSRIVQPDAWWVIRRKAYDRLVLSACHPLYSAAKRIVVFARLVAR